MKSILLAALLAALATTAALAEGRLLRVTGEGRVDTVPDQATISVGVVSRADTARDALGQNARAMQGLMGVLERSGIQPRDIRTTQVSLNPEYTRSSNTLPAEAPRITGYYANTQLQVTVADIAGLGGVLDDLTRAGSNQIGGISFSVADPDPLLDEARRRAVQDARDKARLYASAAGVTLGAIQTIADAPAAIPGPQPFARAEMMAADMPMAPGEVSISAQVTLEYAIE